MQSTAKIVDADKNLFGDVNLVRSEKKNYLKKLLRKFQKYKQR